MSIMSSDMHNQVDLPLIDISKFEFNLGKGEEFNDLHNNPMLTIVRDACKEWGFFSIVNHGVSIDLLQQVESLARDLCSMPAKVKEKAATSNPAESYVIREWIESFCFMDMPHSNSLEEMCDKIWPDEVNSKFRETFRTYAFCMADLARKITIIILSSLGLDVKTFYHCDFKECTANMRINHYFSRGKSMEDEILTSHTDIGCFTILNQDNEGGLQVRSKRGKWLNIKPRPYSFVVNVADTLKAWTNGRYRSAEHRVVYKGWRDRISVPYFVYFPDVKQVYAPAELVDNDHPRHYKPFTVSELKQCFSKNFNSKEEKPSELLDVYADI
ncbi:hypothetical protein SUGI_0852570 [Cryptomeria japonica]|nr:hypothetical protein SUGI_0852570 [Cryptomeria japonica]